MATVIDSLLVRLGFQSDTSGAAAFQGQLDGITGKVAGLAALLGVGMGLGSFVETASQFEQFEVQLTTIQGSSEKAKESMAWISDFAATTPYEMKQVTDAFVKLQSYGLDARKGGLLESVGNMASGMGKDLDQAVEAIADAVNGENERLKEFGIKASKNGEMFTYTYNMDGKEFKVQAKNEAADIQAALQGIMDARFKGGMLAMSKTWAGTLSNLTDTWDMFKLRLMSSGVFDGMKDALNGLMLLIAENKEQIFGFAESVGHGMTRIAEMVSKAAGGFKQLLDRLGLTEPIVKALEAAAIYLGMALVGLAVGGLIQATIALGSFAVATLAAAWPFALVGAAIAAVVLIIDDLMAYANGEYSLIGGLLKDYPWLQKVIDGFNGLRVIFDMVVDSVVELWGQMKMAFSAFDDGTSGANRLGGAASSAFSGIGAVLDAIMPLIWGFFYVLGMVARGWALIAAYAAGAIAQIMGGLVSMVGYIVGGVAGAIAAFVNFFLVTIPNAYAATVAAASNMISNLVAGFNSLVAQAASILPDWLIKLFSGNSTASISISGAVPAGVPAGAMGATGQGGQVINNNQTTTVNVPTAAAAATVAKAANSGAAQTVRASKGGVKQ